MIAVYSKIKLLYKPSSSLFSFIQLLDPNKWCKAPREYILSLQELVGFTVRSEGRLKSFPANHSRPIFAGQSFLANHCRLIICWPIFAGRQIDSDSENVVTKDENVFTSLKVTSKINIPREREKLQPGLFLPGHPGWVNLFEQQFWTAAAFVT